MHPGIDPTDDALFKSIVENPKAYGLPTIKEFMADPARYSSGTDLLSAADDGSKMEGLKKTLGKTYWEIDGYEMKNPEQIERYCRDEGLDPKTDLDFKPYLKEGVSGKIDIVNRFMRKKGLGDAGTKGRIEEKV